MTVPCLHWFWEREAAEIVVVDTCWGARGTPPRCVFPSQSRGPTPSVDTETREGTVSAHSYLFLQEALPVGGSWGEGFGRRVLPSPCRKLCSHGPEGSEERNWGWENGQKVRRGILEGRDPQTPICLSHPPKPRVDGWTSHTQESPWGFQTKKKQQLETEFRSHFQLLSTAGRVELEVWVQPTSLMVRANITL